MNTLAKLISPLPLALALITHVHPLHAAPAVFVKDGHLLIHQPDESVTTISARDTASTPPQPARRVSDYWGPTPDGHLLVTLEGAAGDHLPSAEDPHCSAHEHPHEAWLLNSDGTLDQALSTDTLRLYPNPATSAVALISPSRDLTLWDNGILTTATLPGRVSNAGWSPDGRYLALSIYPPDWSHGAVSEAKSTAEFLRLQNADLYLYDTATHTIVARLTDDPGTEYGPFFSEDGQYLFYTWLHLTEDRGGLMRLYLDRDSGTSASAPALQLTTAGNDPGETPLGRVGTYVWRNGGTRLAFEAGKPDGSGEIWSMTAQGRSASMLSPGRKPQPSGKSDIIFLNNSGTPRRVNTDVQP